MRVLLVEDSLRFQRSIAQALKKSGYAVDVTGDGAEGLWFAENHDYDVLILDLMLPGLDGLTLLERLRRQGKATHVLILTAKAATEDRVRGLQAGADDYLVKPFALEELLARVQALCRRRYGEKRTRQVLGEIEIDTLARQVTCAGRLVELTPREYLVLEYLAARRDQVVTRAEIEAHVCDEHADPMSNVIDVAICNLRRKLHRPTAPPLIQTRRGAGYILETPAGP
jgi:DNA-binding response OmpR family regulator